ncbi:MAG: von Willebrand factor type A domain-containing protein [Planctomycetes bacterium]|nr:von Willebrand factor type A domain-containing protein [Planctomycetota bacterium]
MKTQHPMNRIAIAMACIGAITLAACSGYSGGQASVAKETTSDFDNGTGGIAPANPSAGIFFNGQDPSRPPVNFNQDVRGRFEQVYGDPENARPDGRPDEPPGPGVESGEPYDMFFKQHGVNPFVDTEDDRLSTFAADVDTGSYTVCRDYLNRGNLPPNEAPRTEEFVNYFNYRYAPPANSTFSMAMDCAPSRYGADLKNCHLLRVGLQGKVVDAAVRKPAVLTFVIDISGSMQMENRMGYVKQALRMLVKQLRRDDYVGIAVYGTRGAKLLDHTNDPSRVLEALDSLAANGSTNAEEGIRIGYDMAAANFKQGSINRVILCTDGVANNGEVVPEALLKMIETQRRKGITLSAIGFGMSNYNDTMLETLGDKGDGHYAYIDNMDEAKRVFVDNLTGTLQVIARDVKMQVEFNPAVVKSWRLIGYENRDVADKDFRNNAVDGGEVGAGHSVTALFEIKLFENANGALATTTVRWKHDEQEEYSEARQEAFTKDIRTWEQAPANLRLAASVAEFAELLRHSYWAKNGSFDPVLADLKQVIALTDDNEVLDLTKLVAKARELSTNKSASGLAGGK